MKGSKTMIISMIAAMDSNFCIGKDGDLPWPHLPADMKRFYELTVGKPVIMGRKTYESIMATLGHPLPKRTNIVLTKDQSFGAESMRAEGCIVVHSPQEALEVASEHAEKIGEVMIIGGASVYKLFADSATRLYLTFIREHFEGDTYFPIQDFIDWKETERKEHPADEKNKWGLLFQTFERIRH